MGLLNGFKPTLFLLPPFQSDLSAANRLLDVSALLTSSSSPTASKLDQALGKARAAEKATALVGCREW